MTTWADIQRLAGDLQRVQLANAAQKLSEANCIEVVTRLIDGGAIDVVYTKDGSAYITRSHLCTMLFQGSMRNTESNKAFTALVNSLKEEPFDAFHETLNQICHRLAHHLPVLVQRIPVLTPFVLKRDNVNLHHIIQYRIPIWKICEEIAPWVKSTHRFHCDSFLMQISIGSVFGANLSANRHYFRRQK